MEQKRPGGEMKSPSSSEPTRSQLIPLGGAWQELLTKPYFIPGLIVSLAIALLFSFRGDRSATINVSYGGIPVGVPAYTVVLALFIVFGGAFGVYRMAGKTKSWWLMPVVALFTGLLAFSPLMGMLQSVYGVVLGRSGNADGWVLKFVQSFFNAGLPEETLKAIPVAIGVYVGVMLLGRFKAAHPARQLAVIEPLDGILIGVASGFGFAFAETVFQYVPGVILNSPETVQGLIYSLKLLGYSVRVPQDTSQLQDIGSLFSLLVNKIGFERASFELAQILRSRQGAGLELMIPRLLSGLFGHAAYAGILGYFIGLAALKPTARAKTVLIGLAVAATLHALWNSSAGSVMMFFLLSMAAFVGLAVTIIKARAISPERDQLAASQLIDRFSSDGASTIRSTVRLQPAMAVRPTAPVSVRPPIPAAVPATPAAQVGSLTWDDDSNLRILEVGTARIPATAGARLYERQVPGAHSGQGDAVVAEVTPHPSDPAVLGLKNLSDQAWSLVTAEGQHRELAPGRSIRLVAGLQVTIGDVSVQVR
ncbi:MAG: PrsW family intramembrane metalloprotease [Rhizobacter sp.]